jgi:hypothetical protein
LTAAQREIDVKDGPKGRRLWRSPKAILDKIVATNRNAGHAIKAAFSAFLLGSMSDSED